MKLRTFLNYAMPFGKIMGIPFKIHWSIVLFLVFIPLYVWKENGQWQETVFLLCLMASVLTCVLLHELGHAYAARIQGIKTHDIMLSVIGGIARLDYIPDTPRDEFKIAIAGPLVNLAIFFCLLVVFLITIWTGFMSLDGVSPAMFFNPEYFISFVSPSVFILFIYMLAFSNIVLFLFNLLPVFPMDGGRILRALLASRMDRNKATVIAARIGQVLSLSFVLLGIIFVRPLWSLVGMFVFFMADTEIRQTKKKTYLDKTRAFQIANTNIETIPLYYTMDKLIAAYFEGQQQFIVQHNGRIVGVVLAEQIEQAMRTKDNESTVSHYMTSYFAMIHTQEPIALAHQALFKQNRACVLAMEAGQCVGLITRKNFQKNNKV